MLFQPIFAVAAASPRGRIFSNRLRGLFIDARSKKAVRTTPGVKHNTVTPVARDLGCERRGK